MPGRLYWVFADGRKLASWCGALDALFGKLVRYSGRDFGEDLDLREIRWLVRSIKKHVMASAPREVCRCSLKVTACPICNGRHWTTKKSLRREPLMPPE